MINNFRSLYLIIFILLGFILFQNFATTFQWVSTTKLNWKNEPEQKSFKLVPKKNRSNSKEDSENQLSKLKLSTSSNKNDTKDFVKTSSKQVFDGMKKQIYAQAEKKAASTTLNSEYQEDSDPQSELKPLDSEDKNRLYFTEKSTRIGIVCFVPFKDNRYYLIAFTTLLYSSWKYVVSHPDLAFYSKLRGAPSIDTLVVPDLLVWCAELACKELPQDCQRYDANRQRAGFEPKCFYFPKEGFIGAAKNGWTNSFVYISDPIFSNLTANYDYFIRLDTDTLIAPPMLAFRPQTDVVISRAHYCSDFAQKRLENISEKLNLTTQRVHNIASSWYAKSSLMHEVSKLILKASIHMSHHEFDPTLPGLEGMFKQNPEGIWPLWWRGVSTMYGSELALNAIVPNLHNCCWTEGLLDQSTCNSGNIMTAVQLHCYQTACQFRKFDFLDSIIHIRDSRSLDPRLFRFYADRDVRNMTLRDYSTYIAWHGASRYVQHIHAWVKSALFETFWDPG